MAYESLNTFGKKVQIETRGLFRCVARRMAGINHLYDVFIEKLQDGDYHLVYTCEFSGSIAALQKFASETLENYS